MRAVALLLLVAWQPAPQAARLVEGRRTGATLVKRLVFVLAFVACNKHDDGYRASGTLVFEPREAADVYLATEIEVMRSEPILRRVREQFRTEIAPAAITAKRRAGTMLVDVSVRDKDPQRAAELCNWVMQTYLEYRFSLVLEAHAREQQALAEAVERDPTNMQLREKLTALELERMAAPSGVRVLDACAMPKGKTK